MGTALRNRTNREITDGKFYPLGATPTSDGVNFAIYSQNASEVYEDIRDPGDYQLFFILNADHRKRNVEIPQATGGKTWYRVIDTSLESGKDFLDPGSEVPVEPATSYPAAPRSTVVLLGR
jgi:pullulanase/glycogen debranching enzyme